MRRNGDNSVRGFSYQARPLLFLTLIGAVFLLDWVTPHGHAVYLLYDIAVLLTAWGTQRRYTYGVAALCVLLTVGGFFLSLPAFDISVVIFNRSLSIATLFILATFVVQRKKALEMLKDSEERFREIAVNTQEWIWEIDTEGRYTYSNQTVGKILGYSAEEIVQKHFYELFHPDDMESLKASSLAAFATKRPFLSFVNRKVHKHGQTVWFETSGIPTFDEEGHWLGYRGVDTDTTERKQAEDAMKASEVKYDTLFGNSHFALMTLEPPSWCFASGNSAVVALFGMKSEEEFTRCEPWVLSPERQPDGRASDEKAKEMIETAMREGSHFFDWTHRRIDGEEFPATVLLTRVDQPGKVFLQANVLDITERKRSAEALHTSQLQLLNAMDLAHIVHWEFNAVAQTYVFNDPFYAFYGTTAEQEGGYLVSREDYAKRFIHLDDLPLYYQFVKEGTLKPVADLFRDIEHRIMRRNGEVRYIQVRTRVIKDDSGRVVKRYGANQDITERKLAEEEKAKLEVQIQQAQKMESVGRLAGGVAHDFNNMLGVILGHAEMAMEHMDSSQPQYDDLTEIRKAAERSADLTRQLLAFARKQTIAPMILDLNQIVTDMLNMLQRLIGEDISLNWHPTEVLWQVKIDPSQIDQILANLVVNARDAINGVGKITIETKSCTLDEDYCAAHIGSVPGEYVALTVSDDGCGMDKETLGLIFEPFFTTKGIGKGTGLGLATVYGIVKQNNGFINAYSEMGHGTTFTIYLHRHRGKDDQAAGTEKVAQPAKCGHETILLVEDEPTILKLTQRMIEKQGYTVLAAPTPGEAIRLAKEHSGEINLLMTDVVMPEMNGRDLAKNLLSILPHIKRLFMSGYTADVIANNGVLDEGVHFIQKPFALKSMTTKIREVLDQA